MKRKTYKMLQNVTNINKMTVLNKKKNLKN